MGFLSALAGFIGFGLGVPLGICVGFYLFIYSKSRDDDIQEPVIRRLHELDSKSLQSILQEIPLWVKNPDYERVDWMNKYVSEMWPYLDKAICVMIRSMAKPIFDQYIGSFYIRSIEFDHLTLGSLPPTIHGIKFYETREKELVFEAGVRWAGNQNITIVLTFMSLKIRVQLLDLQIFAAPRVTLKPLVPSFPCFANVTVSLMEKPHVDFGLKILGGDVMAIPGLYRFVQETIKEQIAILYQWPNFLEVHILDSTSGATKKPVGMLHVKVVRAMNLRKMDFLGKSDPYVKLSLSGERLSSKKTSIKMSNLNPVWNENFKLIVKDPRTQALELHAYDWEKVKMHDKLGMQIIPLSLLTPNETKEFTLDLLKSMNLNDPQNRRNRGKIVVELRLDLFNDENDSFSGFIDDGIHNSMRRPLNGGLLSVSIESAENVEGKHHNNPYAMIMFRGEVKKTKVIKKSRQPRWNEEFQFVLDEVYVDEKIHIEVRSKRIGLNFHRRETLGYIEINIADVMNNGRINERYNLIKSRNGVIQVGVTWINI